MNEEMSVALRMCTYSEKTTVLGKDDETIMEWGSVIMGEDSLQKSFPHSGRMCRCAPFLHQ